MNPFREREPSWRRQSPSRSGSLSSGYRWFESGSLQRGVRRQPDLLVLGCRHSDSTICVGSRWTAPCRTGPTTISMAVPFTLPFPNQSRIGPASGRVSDAGRRPKAVMLEAGTRTSGVRRGYSVRAARPAPRATSRRLTAIAALYRRKSSRKRRRRALLAGLVSESESE